LAAGGNGWMQRTPEAASEFPPDLNLTDEEGRNSLAPPAEEAILPSAPPMEEDDKQLEEVIARLRGQALQQVRQYVAVLARMWKDQMPSARTRMIGDLGWHLDPAHESGRVVCRENKPEPAWLLNGTGWIMNKLATIREQKQKAREERFAAVQERLVMLDDGLAAGEACLAAAEACLAAAEACLAATEACLAAAEACLAAAEVCLAAEEACLAENREAELRARIKGIEQLLLVKALGDAADHDRERDDHGGARSHCETHLRYSEGHLQPSEEHLADAKVHL
jgi:hypothetical protein